MAMAFVRPDNTDTGFELVALQSLEGGVNVYVHTNGRWIGGYRPAWYRAHPFRLIRDEQNDRDAVCVDEASPAFQKEASEQALRLFDDDGEPTQRTHDTISFLDKLQQATRVTHAQIAQLEKAGVIVPWPLTTRKPDSEEGRQVKGLYHIDEAALRALDPEVLAQLARSGALSMAYTQLLSEHRLKGLTRLYDLRNKANQQAKPSSDLDLEDLFSDDNDDLSFNF